MWFYRLGEGSKPDAAPSVESILDEIVALCVPGLSSSLYASIYEDNDNSLKFTLALFFIYIYILGVG